MRPGLVTSLLAIALAASLLGCAALAYLWIDRSITLSYVTQSADASDASVRELQYLLEDEWRGMPMEAILQKLKGAAARRPAEKIIVKREGDVIWFNDIRIDFEQGQLKSFGNP